MEASSSPAFGRLRWAILALLFASTVLNYVDRQTLSILASQVQGDLGMSDMDYARVVQYFLIAYTCAYLGAGWITDKLGTKLSLALFVGWWSLANMVSGLVQTAGQLGAARAALGLGEAGNYTAAPKAVSEHFPPAERGLAVGIYTAGAMVGATIAPPLIAWLAIAHSWRGAFVLTGVAGLVWLVLWWRVYRAPVGAPAAEERHPIQWRAILRERPVWGLAAARLIADPVWYFYLFWFPKYLTDGRGMTLIGLASVAWIVYLAADLGSIGGGLLSGQLVKRGIEPARGRLIAMGAAAALAPVGMLIATAPSTGVVLLLAAAVAFAHLVFQVNMAALVVDLYPTRVVATVFGIIAAGSGFGGILSTQLVGQLVAMRSWEPLFLLMGILHPLACLIAWLSTGRGTRRLSGPARATNF